MAPSAIDLPAGGVTGVGSLPMTDPDDAIRFVAETCPEIPFWPQLPGRSFAEGICDQALGGMEDLLIPRLGPARSERLSAPPARGFMVKPGLTDEAARRLTDAPAALDPDHASGLFALDRAVTAGRFPRAAAVKGQIVGPVTLALSLFDGEEPFARHVDLTSAAAARATALALWQVERLKRVGRPVILAVDEPGLGAIGREILGRPGAHLLEALAVIIGAIRRAGAVAGLHCCGEFPLAILGPVQPDLLSFDAHHALEKVLADRDARRFLASGAWVAWGLVPAAPDLGALSAGTIVERWRRAVARAGRRLDAAALARRSLVTASCGLATLDPKAARSSFALAREVARLIAP